MYACVDKERGSCGGVESMREVELVVRRTVGAFVLSAADI